MAFMMRNFGVLSYAQEHTQWMYRTNDTIANACEPDYLRDAASVVKIGDIVTIVAQDGVGMRAVSVHDDKSIRLEKLL